MWRYLRGRTRPDEPFEVGHNPLGSLSVFALLACWRCRSAPASWPTTRSPTVGPLNRFVASATGLAATRLAHAGWVSGWCSGWSALHVAAIAFYAAAKKTNLVRPMLSGDKALPAGTPASADGLAAARAGAGCWWPRAPARWAGSSGLAAERPAAMSAIPKRRHRSRWPAPTTPALLEATRGLFREYAASIGVDLCFQNFEAELAGLPGDYAAPGGALLVALLDGQPAGCGALRPLHDVDYPNACEMKRLYVPRAFRGFGLGRLIAQAADRPRHRRPATRRCCSTRWTTWKRRAACTSTLGFEEIPPYYYNPIPGAHYLKVDLDAPGTLW